MLQYHRIGILFNVLSMLILAGICIELLQAGKHEFAVTVGSKVCILLLLTAAEVKYKISIKHFIRVFVLLTIISDSYFGFYLNLYVTSSVFDKVQHIFGSYAFSLCAYVLAAGLNCYPLSKPLKAIVVLSFGLAIGAMYEISEFFGDTFSNPAIPAQESLLDTDLDLISNLLGALIASTHVVWRDPAEIPDERQKE